MKDKKRFVKSASQIEAGDRVRFGGMPFVVTSAKAANYLVLRVDEDGQHYSLKYDFVELKAVILAGSFESIFLVPSGYIIRIHK